MSKYIGIYGAGAYGKAFLKALKKENICVDFFIDEFSSASECHGIPIYRLDTIPKEATIYISVLQSSARILAQLNNQNFDNVFSFQESLISLESAVQEMAKLNHLWLTEDKHKMINPKIEAVKKLLKDDNSRYVLEKIRQFRLTLSPKDYPFPSGTEYFPADVPILDNIKSLRFIDCGAYTGDTIEVLMQQNKKVDFSISFEPDNNNLLKLNQVLDKQKSHFPDTNFFAYPAGVYSSNDILSFNNNSISSSSTIDNCSENKVSVVSLDQTVFATSPNYIKMDIEGAEKQAIIGAKKTIQKYKPNLAICIYHKPHDLWDLPLLINEIEPSYDMYIRVHEDMCLSTVLYCIAKDK